MRVCPQCNRERPASAFFAARRPDGLHRICKVCIGEIRGKQAAIKRAARAAQRAQITGRPARRTR